MKCAICPSEEFKELPVEKYTKGQPIHICLLCGLVQVLNRRESDELMDAWNSAEIGGDVYHSSKHAVAARHAFVHSFMSQYEGSIIDVGAGDGVFEETTNRHVLSWCYGAEELTDDNYDIATVLWTLENCGNIETFLAGCKRAIKPDGKIVIATGSRIMVPFKKPLHMYLDDSPADMHPWRFSFNSLCTALLNNGLRVVNHNRYIDSDYLVVVAEMADTRDIPRPRDVPLDVINFFHRWDRETHVFYP